MTGQPANQPEPGPTSGHEATTRRRRFAEAAAIAVLALTLNLAGNGRYSLFDRDEPRYAGCTREMIARGDWIYPTFNGEPRYHKPVLIYWIMRVGYALAGDNPFGARLASALAGTATSLVVLGLGRRMLGERAGLLASLMLTTAPLMVVESKLATTDAVLSLFLVGSQACLWQLARRDSARLAAGFWVLMALATLTKGPVGPALIASAGAVSWWLGGPTSMWSRLRWKWGIPLFVAVAAPWYVAIGLISRGDFFRFAVGQQIAARVTSGMEQHGGFPGYYLVTSLITFHPWSSLLPAACLLAWQRRKLTPDAGFLLGWAIGPLILLECVRTKMVHYYLPAIPACALLCAWVVRDLVAEGVNLRRWPLGRLACGLLGGIGLGIGVCAGAGAVIAPAPLRFPCATIALIAGVGTLWGLRRLQLAATEQAVAGLATTWGLIMLTLGAWLLPAAEPYRTSRIVGERLAVLAADQKAEPVLLSFQEPTVVLALRRPAAMIRTWHQLYELVDHHSTVVTAINPIEWPEFQRRRDDLDVDVREMIQGFNLNKGTGETLRLAVVRPRGGRKSSVDGQPSELRDVPTSQQPVAATGSSDPALHRASREKPLVK
ncbi:MAG: glycosyltransferase family 39 protein [Isosphaeraceae bacterium]